MPAGWTRRPGESQKAEWTESRIVSNHDSIIADHATYWDNVEEVIAKLIDEIEDATPPPAFHRSERQVSDDGRERKRRLLPLSLLRPIAWAFPLIFFFFLTLNFWDLREDFISDLDKPVIRIPITWFASTDADESGKFEPTGILGDLGGQWTLDYLVLPVIGSLYVAAASLLVFRFIRDIIWQNYMVWAEDRWHERRRAKLAEREY